MAGLHTNRGAKRARETRAAFGLPADAPLACVLTFVEEQVEVPVVVARLPEGVDGACLPVGATPLLWVGHGFAPRARFTLAHELGHLRCGHEGMRPIETVETLSGQTTTGEEIEANAFAAELLAPKDGVLALCPASAPPTLEDVVRIAARFAISAPAAFFRLVSLGRERNGSPLHAEVLAGGHEDGWAHVEHGDVLGTLTDDDLPRVSPRVRENALGRLVTGEATPEAVAAKLGVDPALLRGAMTLVGAG